MSTPETNEKHAIKQFLDAKGYFHFPIMQGLGCFPGIPDRIAIKQGRVIAIEVKAIGKSGKRGVQSDHQKKFQQRWEENGGVYLVGGIDEVMKKLM